MAAHKYWRVIFKGRTSSPFIMLDEVSFRSASDVDLSTGGSAISGGDNSSGYPASNAFDKSLANQGWASLNGVWPAWIGYNHPSPVEVDSVLVTCEGSATSANLPAYFSEVNVQYSDDGAVWYDWGSSPYALTISGAWSAGQVVRLGRSVIAPTSRAVSGVYLAHGDRAMQMPLNAKVVGVVSQWEVQTTGSGTISGIVTIENIPGSRKVRLFRKQDGMLIRETWSAPNGAYSFTNIDPAWEYFVVAHDHLRVYNGVIQDMLVP